MAAEPVISAKLNPWETAFFGCPVIQLTLSMETIAELGEWLETRPAVREYIITRVPPENVALIHALEQHGFRLLVPMVRLESDVGGNVSDPSVIPAEPFDVPYLAEIARQAFVDGRFFAEPELPREVVGEMYATWIRNCCNKSLADMVLVIRREGRPAGFIAVRQRQIALIAVAPNRQRHGIGSTLIRAVKRPVFAWTPLSNIAAIRMYEKCGFRVSGSALYYRLWRGGWVAA